MTDEMTREDALAHFGVKGMRWGVRRANDNSPSRQAKPRGAIRRGLTKAGVGLDAGRAAIKEGESKLIFLPHKNRQEAASGTQSRMLGEARRLNRDPKYRGKDLKKDAALRKEYHDELLVKAKPIYQQELAKARVRATSDAINSIMSPSQDQIRMQARRGQFGHADGEDSSVEVLAIFDLIKDANGFVTDIKFSVPAPLPLKHSDEGEPMTDADSLAHYGVRGMKWGVTRTQLAKPSAHQIRKARQTVKVEKAKVTLAKDAVHVAKNTKAGAEIVKKAQADYEKQKTAFLNNPARPIAARMTRGEKILTVAALGLTTPIGAGLLTGTAVRSRKIETAQRRGEYGK